ncbi:MAG TPA: protein translocase subunit SecF [Polyangiaceae bacterium LLY-WYZ-14_1]|nr:protein translocase subunit SecF [Polyangiaceae bacterium LLY-WYZ-14_1]
MEIVKPGTQIDFMRYRAPVIALSGLLVLASAVSLFYPGPKYGIDFAGGTELQLAFPEGVTAGKVRSTLEDLGYDRPDVVSVEGSANEYLLRVREISALEEDDVAEIERAVTERIGETEIEEMRVSPGGDKVAYEFSDGVEIALLEEAFDAAGVEVRSVAEFGQTQDHRYEVYLVGVADEVVSQLDEALGELAPEPPRRVEWVGPKAGAQLRDAAIKALLYAIAFIMVYVALRFDLRFAPGGVVAMLHDAFITLGIYVLLRKEVNLTTVAALLTIIGYSINDTIVVYDRIRENMARLRDKSLYELINISTSQMLSRTIVTSGTTLLSVSAFFIWGTPVIQDICFALLVGIAISTYSSIYIAAPITEFMDRRFFSRA